MEQGNNSLFFIQHYLSASSNTTITIRFHQFFQNGTGITISPSSSTFSLLHTTAVRKRNTAETNTKGKPIFRQMKMPSEPEEETSRPPAQPPCAAPEVLMDLDLDLDASWPLDQIFAAAASSPAPPFLLSNSEQPCSPLWAFSDDNNNGSFVAGAGFRLSDSSRILSCTDFASSFAVAILYWINF